MKNAKKIFSVSIIIISLLLSSCSESSASNTISSSNDYYSIESSQQEIGEVKDPESNLYKTLQPSSVSDSQQTSILDVLTETNILAEVQQTISDLSQITFTIEDIIPYSGQPYIIVNNNVPYFSGKDFVLQSFEVYSDLDDLKRCGTAYASIGIDTMPTEEREAIGYIRPSGWHTTKYREIIDGNYLYNRCHLIGYQLSGENDNEKNLITGTRYLNVQGMQPFENMVADYVIETENRVLYRVTPIFEGDNLLASGVLIEAESIEDNGTGIQFCVYVYNVQPGIIIDYATGESYLDSSIQTAEPTSDIMLPATTPETTAEPTLDTTINSAIEPTTVPIETPMTSQEEEKSTNYILNTNTKKFHVPSCKSVKQMKDKNKREFTGTRDEVISMGYDPCKNCNP